MGCRRESNKSTLEIKIQEFGRKINTAGNRVDIGRSSRSAVLYPAVFVLKIGFSLHASALCFAAFPAFISLLVMIPFPRGVPEGNSANRDQPISTWWAAALVCTRKDLAGTKRNS